MHKIDELTGDNARILCLSKPPFGPGAGAAETAQVERIEIWGSGIKDPGPDYCEVRTFDAAGAALKIYRIEGY